jgi:hypothetical protein
VAGAWTFRRLLTHSPAGAHRPTAAHHPLTLLWCRPQPAYFKSDGTWVPSRTNFTSLATPSAVGSGKTALVTLLHEGWWCAGLQPGTGKAAA